jgi:hypothetical protein
LGHGSNGPTSVRHKFQKRKSKKKEILKIFSQILKKIYKLNMESKGTPNNKNNLEKGKQCWRTYNS